MATQHGDHIGLVQVETLFFIAYTTKIQQKQKPKHNEPD